MGKLNFLYLITATILVLGNSASAQYGYYNAPYTRYEANEGTLANGAVATSRSFNQTLLQSEASEQVCVNMSSTNASVTWTMSSDVDGLVIRYCLSNAGNGEIGVYANGVFITNLQLTSYYSWESLWNNGNGNNNGVSNQSPKMRFDEVHYKFSSKILAGQTLRLVRNSGDVHIDFAELEAVPAAVSSAGSNSTYTGNGSDLPAYIAARGGQIIYLPPGNYTVPSTLHFDNANTVLRGAGSWHTNLYFDNNGGGLNAGGINSNASGVSISGVYMNTVRNSRSNSYKAINGAYDGGATIRDVWAEHFECGAWIADYKGGGLTATNGLVVSYCRFRNNYADGINLCRGTINSTVEYCSFRNNGDDDMAIWSAEGWECRENTFRYCTSENTWRASGCAIYSGYNNKAYNLLIQDNVEVGIKVNNAFGGSEFNTGGMHEFTNILIRRCGTNYDLYNNRVGAIDISCYGDRGAGTWVRNVKFSCITIEDSKNDAVYIHRASGDGYSNLVFENIYINGTGREYPDNGGTGSQRGYGFLFTGNASGSATYCGLNFATNGNALYNGMNGNVASSTVNTTNKGSMSWNSVGGCPACTPPSLTNLKITSNASFRICDAPITLSATTVPPAGNSVTNIEFFVDNVSKGVDNGSPYSALWSPTTGGDYTVKAVATYSGGTTSTVTQPVSVMYGVFPTGSAPAIDGTIDAMWNSYAAIPLAKTSIGAGNVTNAADLSAYFKIARDATNLYILIDVNDNDLRYDNTGDKWRDDAVEFFIDKNNDKSGGYGATDFQATYAWGETPNNDTYGRQTKAGNTGYVMEFRVPWSSVGGAPGAGDLMGFDIHVDDDDGPDADRDSKIVFSDMADVAWQNLAVLGTLQISGCTNPLPVELLSFTGTKEEEGVLLNWSTISEKNNWKFVVERALETFDWQPIGEVSGRGNSTVLTHYNYLDKEFPGGVVYYRLRQVDYDGAFAYSHMVAVKTSLSRTYHVSLTPNPFDDAISVRTDVLGKTDVTVRDVLGRIVYQTSGESENGTIIVHPELTAGTYLITIQTESFVDQQKIIKR